MTPAPTDPRRASTGPAIDEEALLEVARSLLDRAYSPYSGVRVGASLIDADGRVFTGCNVENASYGLTLCAERNAIGSAVAEGASHLVAIAIATDRESLLTPCGACRQVLAEFAPSLLVICAGAGGEPRSWRLDELLPEAFRRQDLTP